jgi:hypothetical protein
MTWSIDENWEKKWFRFLDRLNGREDYEFEEFDFDSVYVEGEVLPLVDTFKTWQEEGNLPLPMLLELMVMAYCRDLGFEEEQVLLVLNMELFEKAISLLNKRETWFFMDVLDVGNKLLKCSSMADFKDLVSSQVFFTPREREFLLCGMAEDLMPLYLTSLPFWEKVRLALLPEEAPERESPLRPSYLRVETIELKKFLWGFTLPEVENAYIRWLQGEPFRLPRIHDRVIQALSLEGAVFKLGSREVSPQEFVRVWVLAQTLGKVLGLTVKGPYLSLKGIKIALERFMGDEESPVLPARLKSALVAYLKGIGQDPLRYANILNILK